MPPTDIPLAAGGAKRPFCQGSALPACSARRASSRSAAVPAAARRQTNGLRLHPAPFSVNLQFPLTEWRAFEVFCRMFRFAFVPPSRIGRCRRKYRLIPANTVLHTGCEGGRGSAGCRHGLIRPLAESPRAIREMRENTQTGAKTRKTNYLRGFGPGLAFFRRNRLEVPNWNSFENFFTVRQKRLNWSLTGGWTAGFWVGGTGFSAFLARLGGAIRDRARASSATGSRTDVRG